MPYRILIDMYALWRVQCQYKIKQMQNGKNVAYFFNEEIGKFYYYKDHPMKPRRMAMAHSLIQSFDVYRKLDVYRARKADKEELIRFHHPEYINYLENYVCKDVLTSHGFTYTNDMMLKSEEERKYNINSSKLKSQFSMNETGDCPGFAGLYQFCQISCGGSIDAAQVLLRGDASISINWGGGLHHAKKCQASGFCYTNDIVLAILQLLKIHARVLYVDVDVHHGDGVEQAFYLTDRVMTVSFHQYETDFFPGTGSIDSVGEGKGKYYSLNVPLKAGIDDDSYQELFKTVMDQVMAKYRPGAVVLQLGGDSIAYDLLGRLNLTIKGHGECVKKMMSYGVPLMLLGGGGYTVHNVARLWAYETGLTVGQDLDGYIPKTDRFYEAYQPDSKLHFSVKPTKNKNTPQYLNDVRQKTLQHLRQLQANPGVPFHNVPVSAFATQNIMQNEDKYLSSLLNRRQQNQP